MSTLRIKRLGLTPFEDAWELQESLADSIGANQLEPTLLLLQHPHTFTFGRQGNQRNLLWNEREINERGVAVHWIDRGGDVTYHGPGQLVGYPLLPLGEIDRQGRLPRADYVGYIRRLEEMLIRAIAEFGVPAERINGLTGVWVRPETVTHTTNGRDVAVGSGTHAKIAAIGVKVDRRGISRHGFSLNVDPDMTFWDGIVSCGLEGYPDISMANLVEEELTLDSVSQSVIRSFCETFGFNPLEDNE